MPTILNQAIRNGDIETVKQTVNQSNLQRAFKLSSKSGDIPIIKFLIENKADVQTDDNYAIKKASKIGDYLVAKFLIESRADVSSGNNYAVKQARKKGYFFLVKLLIENKAELI